jgi:hypothetical protein
MSQEIYFIAATQERARQLVAQIRQIRLELEDISVIEDSVEAAQIRHPRSEEFQKEVNRGRVLILVGLSHPGERDRFIDTMNMWGVTEVRGTDEPAA